MESDNNQYITEARGAAKCAKNSCNSISESVAWVNLDNIAAMRRPILTEIKAATEALSQLKIRIEWILSETTKQRFEAERR